MSLRVLLTGATGYVGGRLLTLLEQQGHHVRCLARQPEHLRSRVQSPTEVVAGDLLDPASLRLALAGQEAAYYLVHSMGTAGDFVEQDRQAAWNFGTAARAAGVQRIIYLGGLGDDQPGLSAHLRSRHEVGAVLRESGVPVLELRAAIIIGSGSLSFEMIRALVERLPVMITPRWVRVATQPIAIDDMLAYLLAVLELPLTGSRTFEVGGPDVVSYGELMREYARQRSLRRWMIPVPVLTPRLSSLWLGLVTPLYARVGQKLINSIQHPTVVRDTQALVTFAVHPVGVSEAIARALRNEDRELAQTRWSDALAAAGPVRPWGGVRFGTQLVDSRIVETDQPTERVFATIERIGGRTGWYFGDWLWWLRGGLDLLVGGVGLRRGRRHPTTLATGDVVDCWRVETIERPRRLRLAAEMKLPGRAWLEFEVIEHSGRTTVRQTALFDPVGVAGLAYWYALYPLHELVFAGMLRGIMARANRPLQN